MSNIEKWIWAAIENALTVRSVSAIYLGAAPKKSSRSGETLPDRPNVAQGRPAIGSLHRYKLGFDKRKSKANCPICQWVMKMRATVITFCSGECASVIN